MAIYKAHPNCGKRLMPTTIDEIARDNPDRIWMSIPKTSNLNDGFEDINFSRLANAINRVATFIASHIGSSENFETFAYIGKSDIRYPIVALAAAKTGWQALFSSHMNSLPGHLSLLEKCDCTTLMSSEGADVNDIMQARPMLHFTMPSLEEVLEPELVPHFPYAKTWHEAKWDPYLVLHTSGTTGLPKPITLNHRVPAAMDAHALVDTLPSDEPGYQRIHRAGHFKGRVLCPFAPFHVIICNFLLAMTVFNDLIIVFPTRDGMAGASDIIDAVDKGNVEKAFLSPALLTEMSKTEAGLSSLGKFKSVFYGGGILPQQAGDAISKRTLLVNTWGTTENGGLILGQLDATDWDHLTFDPKYNGIEWRLTSESLTTGDEGKTIELYEMVIVKKKELKPYQTTFLVYPYLDEWPVGDLWSKHPTRPYTWKFEGRNDDLICYANGLKYHPIGTEGRVTSHSLVSACLMFGEGHLQPVLLVELNAEAAHCATESVKGRGQVELDVWNLVVRINASAPSVGKIDRTHILFATPARPFSRASKGTVQRKATIQGYNIEIQDLYKKYGDSAAAMLGRTGDTSH